MARAYASAVASYRFDAGPAANLAELPPLCTPQWLAVLQNRAGAPTSGEWDQVVANREVAVARVVSVHPSRGAALGLRAVVALRVEVTGAVTTSRAAVITVEMVELRGRWLVGFSS
ncbi:MAG: hypothetical protein KY439_00140 [Actinobacteria bacterium]|nr:hypothetical protein [Actinomycetota bacterium]